jgi:hypothetical protein
MTVAFVVNAFHVLAEETAVGGGVAEGVESDVIVDHLMEDGVLDEFFGQVETGIDTEDEILVSNRAEEP